MTYLYQTITESDFHSAFIQCGREEQFSREGRAALFKYLEELAEDTGTPYELDVISLCCDFSEYADIEEYNREYDTDYKSWEKVNEETIVIEHSNGAAIVMAH